MKGSTCQRSHHGLTLIELLVAMTLLSVIIGLTLSMLFNVQKTQGKFDEKYKTAAGAEQIVANIESSLRLTHKLIRGKSDEIVFLDIRNDTVTYELNHDTLCKNGQPVSTFAVDSLQFYYIKPGQYESISDFYILDGNNDGVLDGIELRNVSGIIVQIACRPRHSKMHSSSTARSRFIVLRNVSY